MTYKVLLCYIPLRLHMPSWHLAAHEVVVKYHSLHHVWHSSSEITARHCTVSNHMHPIKTVLHLCYIKSLKLKISKLNNNYLIFIVNKFNNLWSLTFNITFTCMSYQYSTWCWQKFYFPHKFLFLILLYTSFLVFICYWKCWQLKQITSKMDLW